MNIFKKLYYAITRRIEERTTRIMFDRVDDLYRVEKFNIIALMWISRGLGRRSQDAWWCYTDRFSPKRLAPRYRRVA
jgi:hypothetical protein